MPFVSRTRATLRSAAFGFFGVWVKTRTHTPRFCGLFCSAGLLVLLTILSRPLRTSWLIVGTGKKLPLAHAPAADGLNSASGLEALKLGARCKYPKDEVAWRGGPSAGRSHQDALTPHPLGAKR